MYTHYLCCGIHIPVVYRDQHQDLILVDAKAYGSNIAQTLKRVFTKISPLSDYLWLWPISNLDNISAFFSIFTSFNHNLSILRKIRCIGKYDSFRWSSWYPKLLTCSLIGYGNLCLVYNLVISRRNTRRRMDGWCNIFSPRQKKYLLKPLW